MPRLLSAPYCVVVVCGMREREVRGRDGGGAALICCSIRKITFLLMSPSGRLLYLVVCAGYLFLSEGCYENSIQMNQK